MQHAHHLYLSLPDAIENHMGMNKHRAQAWKDAIAGPAMEGVGGDAFRGCFDLVDHFARDVGRGV